VIAPASRNTVFFNALAAQIFYIGTPYLRVFNNTCIYTGRRLRTNQLYAVAELDVVPSAFATVFNNYSLNASVAGVVRSNLANGTVESRNVIAGSANLVVNCVGLGVLTAGTGTIVGRAADVELDSAFYSPAVGSQLVGTGQGAPGGTTSFSGLALGLNTPIGASHATFI
jgi:hypothetical protein